MTHDAITISPGPRLRAAMILAVIADALQIVVFPLFVAGAGSPADDILDLGMGAVLTYLLGFSKVRNYDGSWTEWGNLVQVPIENPSAEVRSEAAA